MRTLLVAAALVAGTPGLADHVYRSGPLTVDHPVIFEGPPTQSTAAGYFTVRNDGDAPDRLIGVVADVPGVSLHETREADGVTRMLPVDIVEIAAGESVAFAPGGLHVMFVGVNGSELRTGAEIAATLVFDRAGEVAVSFLVEPRDGAHDHHGHGS